MIEKTFLACKIIYRKINIVFQSLHDLRIEQTGIEVVSVLFFSNTYIHCIVQFSNKNESMVFGDPGKK